MISLICAWIHGWVNNREAGNLRRYRDHYDVIVMNTFRVVSYWLASIKIYNLKSFQWRHNGHDGVSNHQPHDCLLNRLFRYRSKKTSKPASLAFVRGIHGWPVNSPHKGPVTRKMFPFDDVIMSRCSRSLVQITVTTAAVTVINTILPSHNRQIVVSSPKILSINIHFLRYSIQNWIVSETSPTGVDATRVYNYPPEI